MAEFLYAHTRLITAIFYAATAVCLSLYAIFFALALRPKRGTLEWIALYDRPGLQLGAARHPLRRRSLAKVRRRALRLRYRATAAAPLPPHLWQRVRSLADAGCAISAAPGRDVGNGYGKRGKLLA